MYLFMYLALYYNEGIRENDELQQLFYLLLAALKKLNVPLFAHALSRF